ncbi:MAG: lytic transglycosylase domain-containing protein [Kiritimatiellia bacterium]|nr:lytic transglycosylase domain-containing protein [Kiritimatiellia bacterium]
MHRFFTLLLSLFMFSALNYYSGAETAERLFLTEQILPADKDLFVGSDAHRLHKFTGLPDIIASASGETAAFPRDKIIWGNPGDNFIMPDLSWPGVDIKKTNNHLISNLKGIFQNEGVPPDLVWLAEVESALNPKAESKAGAVGLFQLMPTTAERFGLKIFPVDDRTAPDKSAKAAACYLRYLRDQFGCWTLALAAYNAGEGRVGRAMKLNGARTFSEVAPYLPSETRRYVPRVMAIMALREDQIRGVPSAACFRP